MIRSQSFGRQSAWLLLLVALLVLAVIGTRTLQTATPLTTAHTSAPGPVNAAAAGSESQSGSVSSTQRSITASEPQVPIAAAPATSEQPPVDGPPGTAAQCPPRGERPCVAP